MCEEGRCLSKLCPSAGHGAAPPVLGTDTGTRQREQKADLGHGKQRGVGTEKRTKVQGAEKNMESQAADYFLHLIEIPMQAPF